MKINISSHPEIDRPSEGPLQLRRLAILMACFNRRDKTLTSLQCLFEQEQVSDLDITVFLVDDGSTDGTGEAVAARFPQVRLLTGNGDLYWGGGTRMAFEAALKGLFDAYIWLNDDTYLYKDALRRLTDCATSSLRNERPNITVASMCDPVTKQQTYGGYSIIRRGLRIHFIPVQPSPAEPRTCDAMNGNFIIIPHKIAQTIGNVDRHFRQQRGDIDYSLRARKAGFSILLAPGFFGECAQNPTTQTWRDRSLPFQKRWNDLLSPKGSPFSEWVRFTRRHFGWRWPLYALSPYVKMILGVKC